MPEHEQGIEILVVDDDDAIRTVVEMTLKRGGYRSITAATGELAIEIARARQPALILLDVGLPGIDGLEVCRALKADQSTRGIKIVILTARVLNRDRDDSLAAGADGFVTKPFLPRSLLQEIERQLRA